MPSVGAVQPPVSGYPPAGPRQSFHPGATPAGPAPMEVPVSFVPRTLDRARVASGLRFPRRRGALAASVLLLGVLALAAATPAFAAKVTFQYVPPGHPHSVAVAGSFNNWDTSANPMTETGGVWKTTLELAAGDYQYKYVVDGTTWVADDAAPKSVDDGYGGKNSVVTVGPAAGAAPAAAPVAATPAETPSGGGTPVTFRYRPKGAANSVSVAGSFNNWDVGANPMTVKDGVWTVTVPLAPGSYQYKFVVDGSQWYADETAQSFADDGYGGKNSVVNVGAKPVTVGEPGAAAPPAGAAAPPAAAATAGGTVAVTFRYQPVIGGVNSVAVAGSFNDWDVAKSPLADADQDGIWEATLQLAPGSYQYKFVVNGDQWFADDYAMDSTPDGYGGQNAVVKVGSKPLTLGPGGNVQPGSGSGGASGGLHEVTFRYKPAAAPKSVMLAGSFNDWNVGKNPMAGPDQNGEYTATLLLPEDDYQYKFVVDGNWTTDRAHADSYVDDGFGGQNGVVHVDDRFPVIQVATGDGKISDAGLRYEQSATLVNNMGGGKVELTFPAHKGDIQGMDLLVADAAGEHTVALAPKSEDGAFQYWSATVAEADPRASFRYVPAYKDAAAVEYLTGSGFTGTKPAADAWFSFDPASFPPFDTPDWVKDAVIYQIFPDRFRNGDTANDPDFSEWYYAGKTTLPPSGKTNDEYYHLVKDWSDVSGLTKSPYRTDGKPDYFSFYGGDLAGVSQELDYLKDLGVTAIYFNPLFQAKSNHKYDCADYMKIDPHFGTNDEFKALVQAAHAKGIRVILDIVFNHTGNDHWAFQDAVKNGPKSQNYPWYEFKKWPLPPTSAPPAPNPRTTTSAGGGSGTCRS